LLNGPSACGQTEPLIESYDKAVERRDAKKLNEFISQKCKISVDELSASGITPKAYSKQAFIDYITKILPDSKTVSVTRVATNEKGIWKVTYKGASGIAISFKETLVFDKQNISELIQHLE
jgi:hypothetical protein